MLTTSAKLAIVDTTQGMEVLCFANRLEAVRALMENARIAPNHEHYGCPAHEAAVKNIRDHCDLVLRDIAEDRAQDAAIARGEVEPEQA